MCPDFSTPKSAKNREKAQEKAPAKNVNFFVAFFDVSGVVYFLIFFLSTEISKIFKLYYIKISESQKAPLFWFLRFAQFAKRKAQRRGKKRHFCAKSQDLDTLPVGFVCLLIDFEEEEGRDEGRAEEKSGGKRCISNVLFFRSFCSGCVGSTPLAELLSRRTIPPHFPCLQFPSRSVPVGVLDRSVPISTQSSLCYTLLLLWWS